MVRTVRYAKAVLSGESYTAVNAVHLVPHATGFNKHTPADGHYVSLQMYFAPRSVHAEDQQDAIEGFMLMVFLWQSNISCVL